MRAIDFHVPLPTPEWLDVSLEGYVEAAERYFRSKVARNTLEGLAREYAFEELDDGMPRIPLSAQRSLDTAMAQLAHDYPESNKGIGGAAKILPVTFVVIVATVTLYGLTAVPAARRLGVARPARTRPLLVGGAAWSTSCRELLSSWCAQSGGVDDGSATVPVARRDAG